MFDSFISSQVNNDSLVLGSSIDWVLPGDLVEGFEIEGYFRLMDVRKSSVDLPSLPNFTYQVGSKMLNVSIVDSSTMKHLIMWVSEFGPYNQVSTQSVKQKAKYNRTFYKEEQ